MSKNELLTSYKYTGALQEVSDYGNMNHIIETLINNFEYFLREEGGYSGPEVEEKIMQAGPAILEVAKVAFLTAI